MQNNVDDGNDLLRPIAASAINQLRSPLDGKIKAGDISSMVEQLGGQATWYVGDKTIIVGQGLIQIVANDWHIAIMKSYVTGAIMCRIIGDAIECEDYMNMYLTPLPASIGHAIQEEVIRTTKPYAGTPMPGKKKARSTLAPNDLEAGGRKGTPVFGVPESGKKTRK